MEAIRFKAHSSTSFKGTERYVLEAGKEAGKFALKKKQIGYVDTLSFITALTSMTGFAAGGYGLIQDFFGDAINKRGSFNKNSKNTSKMIDATIKTDKFKDFETANKQIINVKQDKEKKEGARTIIPSTKTAKIGLIFAKIGIAFSGIAGVFNGISMGLPLMAAGEALNVCSSPIVETPVGTGLFGIALAAVFSGRALENDPLLKMDKVKLKHLDTKSEKIKYVLKNIADCAKEVWSTAVLFSKKIPKLFMFGEKNSAERKETVQFFKNSLFSIKPKGIVIQEFVDRFGKVQYKAAFKNNPYLMHSASLLLAIGGVTLTLCSLFKNKIGQKIGLTTYETGGSIDNLSLSRWGMEKAAIAGSPTQKLAGSLLGLSGVTIMAGQPGVDTKWGRGTQWLGTALLFSVFAVERKADAFKALAEKGELQTLIRQHEIDLTKLFPKEFLNAKIEGSPHKTRLDSIINAIKEEKAKKPDSELSSLGRYLRKLKNKFFPEKEPLSKTMEDKTLKAFLDFVKDKLDKKEYIENNLDLMTDFENFVKEKGLKLDYLENLRSAFSKSEREGNFKEATSLLEKATREEFKGHIETV